MSNWLSGHVGTLRRIPVVALTLAAAGCAAGDAISAPPSRSPASSEVHALGAARGTDRGATGEASQSAGTLLACPTNSEARATAWIGPAGGSVEARGVTLTVPPGAVAVATPFEVVVPVSQTMTADIHVVGTTGFTFRTTATITLNFARCISASSAPLDQLQGAHVDVATGAILELMGGTVDRSGHKLSFPTSHLSGYAIAY